MPESGVVVAHDLEAGLAAITEVLIDVAAGRFEARAPRSYGGDPLDVLAYLVNSTAEEVAALVAQLRAERDELQRAQAKLVHAAKLAALGELAGGVAHELNQPLTAILSILELSQITRTAPRADDLEVVRRATERMARIVDGVLSFAKRPSTGTAPVPARTPVDAALELVSDQLRRDGVRFVATLAEPLPLVLMDVDGLQQVLVNLLLNARDAVIQHGTEAPCIHVDVRAMAESVVYSVTDNGPGVAPEDREHLFDPFFTTKGGGKGTGLGLSISFRIVREHEGEIMFEPGPSGGARFVIRIPISGRPRS